MLFCLILLLLFPENGSVGGTWGIIDPGSQADILQLPVTRGGALLPEPAAWGIPPCVLFARRWMDVQRTGESLMKRIEAKEIFCLTCLTSLRLRDSPQPGSLSTLFLELRSHCWGTILGSHMVSVKCFIFSFLPYRKGMSTLASWMLTQSIHSVQALGPDLRCRSILRQVDKHPF